MNSSDKKSPRYRFAAFTVSPSRRLLLRDAEEIALIPRYFDLLVLLIERRNEAVPRREIFDTVWSDVVVTDGALSQAVRILRRTLGDNPRTPTFIRTVSRHGYRFVYPDIAEENDDEPLEPRNVDTAKAEAQTQGLEKRDPFEEALAELLGANPNNHEQEDDWREAAETLHSLGTEEALRRLNRRRGHEAARAILRDTRWNIPGAGPVPLLGQTGSLETIRILVQLRLHRAIRLAGKRWVSGVFGGGAAGGVAGLLGGLVLRFGPESIASNNVLVALPFIGLVVGGLGAAGVGAGLSAAETIFRSIRGLALVVLGAVGGGLIGAATHLIGRLTLEGLFGRDLSPVAGGFEGLVIGGAAGLGYALSTPRADGGMASPRGKNRLAAALVTGLTCALAGMVLAWTGRHLGAMSLDFMARTFPGSQVGLTPLAHLLGEMSPGTVTRTVISAWEGLMFGFGLIFGLTRRPRTIN
jgi:DNA-binding winged helix-turn-helix (wHTH) protein